MACWPTPNEYGGYEDYPRVAISQSRSCSSSRDSISRHSSSSSAEESAVRHVDYRKATPLFKNIEQENWERVLTFLNTGRWSSSMLTSTHEHLRGPVPEIQTKTWVTSFDRKGKPEWSQLPLHAAISYNSPFVVVKKLVELYPSSVRCTDNEGMLPIHLAFGFGAQENVLALLLEPFPDSINEKGLGGRYPYECCELGPNKVRGTIFKTVADQVARRTRQEAELELRKFVTHATETSGVASSVDLSSSDKPLTDFILELLKDRKELQDLKSRKKSSKTLRGKDPSTPNTSDANISLYSRSSRTTILSKALGSKMKSKVPLGPKPARRGSFSKKFNM
eukprot:CAMPEP_0168820520 /NCGR_PEP_ID=MMETSP0726-20121227/8890_1 /TAXON_ID=265536 /ORGANISM="Amphiprora sp., Strain CCMP467" /LENGTH=335 /DNA_ID=CAMNT_0008873031 /DNA_START=8 /DNA_END=1015 /DNA_ORIENTATION=-